VLASSLPLIVWFFNYLWNIAIKFVISKLSKDSLKDEIQQILGSFEFIRQERTIFFDDLLLQLAQIVDPVLSSPDGIDCFQEQPDCRAIYLLRGNQRAYLDEGGDKG